LQGKDVEMKDRRKKVHPASRAYEEGLDKRLKSPEFAIAYLNAILDENDPDLLLLGLRDVARASIGKAFIKHYHKAGTHGSGPSWMFYPPWGAESGWSRPSERDAKRPDVRQQ
jgi:hypothetical protein